MSRPIRWGALTLACLLPALTLTGLAPRGGALHAQELEIEAPRFTFDSAARTYTYEDAQLKLGSLTLFATEMTFDARTNLVRASGFVRVETPTVAGTAARLELDAEAAIGTFYDANLYDQRSGLYLRAAEVVIHPDGRLVIRNCTLTSCPPEAPIPWSIAASSVDLEPEGLGVAWNSRLWIGAVPVLWVPGIAWPTVQERRSGLLPATLSNESSSLPRFDLGWRLVLPVFINLSFDQDLTVTPEAIQNRGTALGLEYNYAFLGDQRGRLLLWGIDERDPRDPALENDVLSALGESPATDALRRYRLDWTHNQRLGDAGRVVLSYRDTSDGQARREYAHVNEYRPFETYQASATGQWQWLQTALTYERNADFQDESVYADDERFTDLAIRPQLLPRFTAEIGGRVLDALPLTLTLGLGAMRFAADERVGGQLFTASPTLTLPIALGGAFELRPTLTRHAASYEALVEDESGAQTALAAESFQQTAATVELRTALARVYPREAGPFDAIKHTLTPRLIFTTVQDVQQPLTDQVLRARVAQRLVTLRVDNRWLGRPRVLLAPEPADGRDASDASAVSADTAQQEAAGSTPARPPALPPREFLSLDVIQRYNLLLEPDAPTLTGPTLERDGETAPGEPLLPLLVELSATGEQVSASAMVNYHHQLSRSTQTRLALSGRAGNRTALSVSYAFNEFSFATPDNKLVSAGNTLTLGGAFEFTEAVSLGFSGRINLTDREPPLGRRIDRNRVFVDFRPVCYAMRVSYSEEVVESQEAGQDIFVVDRSLRFSFDLSGFVGGRQPRPEPQRASPTDFAPDATAFLHAPASASCSG